MLTRETRKIAALKGEKERNCDYDKQISSRAWLRFTFYRYLEILLALSEYIVSFLERHFLATTDFFSNMKNLAFPLNALCLHANLNLSF